MDDGGSPFDGGRYHYAKLGGESKARPEPGAGSVPPPGRPGASQPVRRRRVADRVIGILLGLVLGIGIVTAYVFLGSEETIDAPRVQHEQPRDGASGSADHGTAAEGSNP